MPEPSRPSSVGAVRLPCSVEALRHSQPLVQRRAPVGKVRPWLAWCGTSLLAFASTDGRCARQDGWIAPAPKATSAVGATLEQCVNGTLAAPAPCTWIAGSANSSTAHWLEGDSVPVRVVISGLQPATSHSVSIEWDTTRQGQHPYDYLTGVYRSEGSANPCLGLTGCGASIVTYPIPPDPSVSLGPDGVPGTEDDIVQVPGSFSWYDGTPTGVSSYVFAGSPAGDSTTGLTVQFDTGSSSTVVLAFSAHIATRNDWAPAPVALDLTGAPYHVRLVAVDGVSVSQDRSVSEAAVYRRPELGVSVVVVNDDGGSAVASDFVLTVNAVDPEPLGFLGTPPPGSTLVWFRPGSYAVLAEGSEFGGVNYAVAYGAGCSGNLAVAQGATCTVTYDDLKPNPLFDDSFEDPEIP